jgi:hypothetical protein
MNRPMLMLALTLAVASPAGAQSRFVEVDDATIVQPFGQAADTVDNWDVYSATGGVVGDVEDVLGPDRATATALGVDFDGKEGYADRDVIVPLDQFVWQDGRLVLNATSEAVGQMQGWDD